MVSSCSSQEILMEFYDVSTFMLKIARTLEMFRNLWFLYIAKAHTFDDLVYDFQAIECLRKSSNYRMGSSSFLVDYFAYDFEIWPR